MKRHNRVFQNAHSSPSIISTIKLCVMSSSHSTVTKPRNVRRIMVRKPKVSKLIGDVDIKGNATHVTGRGTYRAVRR